MTSAAAQGLYEQGLAIFRETRRPLGHCRHAGRFGKLGDGNSAMFPQRIRCTGKASRIFQALEHKRGIARLLECFACLAAVQLEAERSLRLAGAAAALRQNIGAPLTPAEQAKLEAILDPARQALTNTASATAWLEGWAMPVERAIEEVLTPEAAPPSS